MTKKVDRVTKYSEKNIFENVFVITVALPRGPFYMQLPSSVLTKNFSEKYHTTPPVPCPRPLGNMGLCCLGLRNKRCKVGESPPPPSRSRHPQKNMGLINFDRFALFVLSNDCYCPGTILSPSPECLVYYWNY